MLANGSGVRTRKSDTYLIARRPPCYFLFLTKLCSAARKHTISTPYYAFIEYVYTVKARTRQSCCTVLLRLLIGDLRKKHHRIDQSPAFLAI